MKEMLDLLEKDIRKEHFSECELLVYGIIAPIVLIIIMAIAGWMETLV